MSQVRSSVSQQTPRSLSISRFALNLPYADFYPSSLRLTTEVFRALLSKAQGSRYMLIHSRLAAHLYSIDSGHLV